MMAPLLGGGKTGSRLRLNLAPLLLAMAFAFHWHPAQAQIPLPGPETYPTGGSAAPTGTQGLRFSPSLSVTEVFSDNVALATTGSERSEWTTRIRPSITITENSARLRLSASYTPELLYRAVQGTTDIYQYLNALGTAELWSRKLFLDVRASVNQQNVSLLGPQSESNLNTTSNRTSSRTYSISPYLKHEFGFDATAELRFTHDAVHFGGNSGSVSNSTSERLDARLSSGPAFKLFVWNVAASRSHTEYPQTGQTIDAHTYSVSGGRLLIPELRANATLGYEQSGYPSAAGKDLKGTFWSIGPDWTPTERTRLAATFGRRYFGPWRTLQLSHRARRTVLSLDYNESVSSTRGNLTVPVTTDTASQLDRLFQARYPDPIARQSIVQAFITALGLPATLTQPLNFLTDNFFVEKRLQGSAVVQGVRNTIVASLYSSNRTSLTAGAGGGTAGDFNSSANIRQTGANISWGSRLSETLAATVGVSAYRNNFSSLNRTDRLTTYRIGLTRDFSPKVVGSLTLARLKNDSDVAAGDYVENSVTATLNMKY